MGGQVRRVEEVAFCCSRPTFLSSPLRHSDVQRHGEFFFPSALDVAISTVIQLLAFQTNFHALFFNVCTIYKYKLPQENLIVILRILQIWECLLQLERDTEDSLSLKTA